MKIAVFQLGRIGDMILLTPVFRALREFFPNAQITAITGSHNWNVIKNNPSVDNIIIYNKKPLNIIDFIRKIRKEKFDYWLDPKNHYSSESEIFAKISNAKVKIGFNKENSNIFDISIPAEEKNNTLHYSEMRLIAVKNLIQETSARGLDSLILKKKLENISIKPELFTENESEDYLKIFLRVNKISEYYVLNISASSEHKMWDNSSWTYFLNNTDLKDKNIVLSYAPEEKERADDLLKLNKFLIRLPSRNFFDVISLIKNCELLITPDTSLVHVSAAFDKPLFALFSGLEEFYVKFNPLNSIFKAVKSYNGDIGIKGISPEKAVREWNEFIREFEI